MRRSLTAPLAFLALAALGTTLLAVAASAAPGPAGPLAVIMARDARLDGITLHDLSRLYLAQVQSVGGFSLTPVNLSSSHPARETFIRRVHGMSLFEMKQFWISVRLKGLGRPPVSYDTEAAVRAAVKRGGGVIGYLPAEPSFTGDVKVLAVDGKRPGEPGYPL